MHDGIMDVQFDPASIAVVMVVACLFLGALCWIVKLPYSWLSLLWRFLLAMTFISIPWNWWHLYMTKVAEQNRELLKEIPGDCGGQSMLSFMLSAFTFSKDKCTEYHIRLNVNPMLEVTPLMAIAVTFTKFVVEPMELLGKAMSRFIKGALEDLPIHLHLPVLLLYAVMLLLMLIMLFGYNVRLPFFSIERAPRLQQLAGIEDREPIQARQRTNKAHQDDIRAQDEQEAPDVAMKIGQESGEEPEGGAHAVPGDTSDISHVSGTSTTLCSRSMQVKKPAALRAQFRNMVKMHALETQKAAVDLEIKQQLERKDLEAAFAADEEEEDLAWPSCQLADTSVSLDHDKAAAMPASPSRTWTAQKRSGEAKESDSLSDSNKDLLAVIRSKEVRNEGTTTPRSPSTTSDMEGVAGSSHATSVDFNGYGKVALPILAVQVRSPNSNVAVSTCALLDPDSNNTLCTQELITKLGVWGRPEITVSTLNRETCEEDSTVARLTVSRTAGGDELELPCVYIKESLPKRQYNMATRSKLKEWSHLKDVRLPAAVPGEVMLIIGDDCPEALEPLTTISGRAGEPHAILTKLGWAISWDGPLGDRCSLEQHPQCE